MTVAGRPLSRALSRVVAELELRQEELVTAAELAELVALAELTTPPKVVAARLRAAGWLLATAQRGVYEFAPAAHAGPRGHGDPFVDLKAAMLAGQESVTVALHSALWLGGLAERAPERHELAVPVGTSLSEAIKQSFRIVRFARRLPATMLEELPVEQPATVLVHLATKPGDVRDWSTFAEALPELAEHSELADLERELNGRPKSVRPRLAYLLSGVAPAIADELQPSPPAAVTWIGAGRTSRRFDKRFNVADGLLPFDPRSLGGAT